MKRLFLALLLIAPLPQALNNPSTTNTSVILGRKIGANFNSTADQAISMPPTGYSIAAIEINNASISLTTAVGGFYSAASKGGTVLVPATQTYTFLTGSTKRMDAALTSDAVNTKFTLGTVYFALTTAQGAAATADIYVIGRRF